MTETIKAALMAAIIMCSYIPGGRVLHACMRYTVKMFRQNDFNKKVGETIVMETYKTLLPERWCLDYR
jgi:hypothetical protein